MKPLLIVMAHKAAEPILERHAEMFLGQGCDVMGYSPQDGTIFPWPASMAYGRSEHSGPAMIARMHWLLRTAARLSDRIIVTEDDQVFFGQPLGERKWHWSGLSCPIKPNFDPAFAATWYCAVPWVLDAKTANLIADEIEAMVKINDHLGWRIERGFSDRTLGLAVHRLRARKAMTFHAIKDHWTEETEEYEKTHPHLWDDLARDIHHGKVTMVHMIKTVEHQAKLAAALRALQLSGIPA